MRNDAIRLTNVKIVNSLEMFNTQQAATKTTITESYMAFYFFSFLPFEKRAVLPNTEEPLSCGVNNWPWQML